MYGIFVFVFFRPTKTSLKTESLSVCGQWLFFILYINEIKSAKVYGRRLIINYQFGCGMRWTIFRNETNRWRHWYIYTIGDTFHNDIIIRLYGNTDCYLMEIDRSIQVFHQVILIIFRIGLGYISQMAPVFLS